MGLGQRRSLHSVALKRCLSRNLLPWSLFVWQKPPWVSCGRRSVLLCIVWSGWVCSVACVCVCVNAMQDDVGANQVVQWILPVRSAKRQKGNALQGRIKTIKTTQRSFVEFHAIRSNKIGHSLAYLLNVVGNACLDVYVTACDCLFKIALHNASNAAEGNIKWNCHLCHLCCSHASAAS